MEIEEAIKTYLATKTDLTALIDTRILTDSITDGTQLPCVVYQKISDVKDHTHDGQSSLERPVFQYSAYSTSKATTRSIANAIKNALQDYSGTLSGITIPYIKLMNEMSTAEQSADGTQRIFVEDLEYQINFFKELI